MPLVLTEIEDAVAIVTLNRPEAMNALSKALRAELARRLTEPMAACPLQPPAPQAPVAGGRA